MLDAGVAMSLCFVFLFTEWRYLFPVIIVIMTLPKIIILEVVRVSSQAIVEPLMPELVCLARNHIST